MKTNKDTALDGLHDAYLIGIDLDHLTNVLALKLRLNDAISSLIFRGVSRFLLTEMLMQNIVYDIKELLPGSDAFKNARASFDKTYWSVKTPGSRIVEITASLGAELFIEFESVEKLTH